MSEEFDDYEIQEGCTVQPETKDELITIIQQAISDCADYYYDDSYCFRNYRRSFKCLFFFFI